MSQHFQIHARFGAEPSQSDAKRFDAVIYRGDAMVVRYLGRIVVDLAGVEPSKTLTAIFNHDPSDPLGNFELTNDGRTLKARGAITVHSQSAREIVASARRGFRWQASIDAQVLASEEIRSGVSVSVNSRMIRGPFSLVRASKLRGFSFVGVGADADTEVSIAAARCTPQAEAHGYIFNRHEPWQYAASWLIR